MLLKSIVSVFLLIAFGRVTCENARTINCTIPDGVIQGQINTTINNNVTYCSFRGIPYAKPPEKNLRFANPVKNDKWKGLHDATYDRSQCIQYADLVGSTMSGSEDCLYINVYAPYEAFKSKANLPVLVWIHGGTFITGNSSYVSYGPDNFLEQELVFVSFNYRLGIFGFLSTEDEACPGNWGIKDQILALKWVQKNIAYFGGNPDNVTVYGESAGAVSVSILVQAKLAKGLFNKAIMSSGSSLNLWGLNTRGSQTSALLAAHLGITSTNNTDLVEQLREKKAEELQKYGWTTALTLFASDALRGAPWGPVMEPDVVGAVLTNPSEYALSQGDFNQVPVLMGMNSNEAAVFSNLPLLLRFYFNYYDIAVSLLTPYSMTKDDFKRFLAGEDIKYEFFGLLPISTAHDELINFVSADQFFRPIRKAAKLMSKYVNVYFYTFGYQGLLSGIAESNRTYDGVGHAEDLEYLFNSSHNRTAADVDVSKMLVKIWSNFAKYGNPTPYEDQVFNNTIWPTVNASAPNFDYMSVNKTMVVAVNPKQEIWDYYSRLWSKYGDEPKMTTY